MARRNTKGRVVADAADSLSNRWRAAVPEHGRRLLRSRLEERPDSATATLSFLARDRLRPARAAPPREGSMAGPLDSKRARGPGRKL